MDTETAAWTLRSQPRYVYPPAHQDALVALRAAGFTRAIFGKPHLHPELGHAVWDLVSIESGNHLRDAFSRDDVALYYSPHPDFAKALFWEKPRLSAYLHFSTHRGSDAEMWKTVVSMHDSAVLAQLQSAGGSEWILDSDRITVTPVKRCLI